MVQVAIALVMVAVSAVEPAPELKSGWYGVVGFDIQSGKPF